MVMWVVLGVKASVFALVWVFSSGAQYCVSGFLSQPRFD